ncbi:MAG: AI-2E family transporter [Terracidiphilus sp.]
MDNFRKRAVFVVLISVVSILLLWLTWTARYVLLLLFASCIGALILSTFTNWLRSCIPMRRGIAFAIVITIIGLMIALLTWTRGSLLLQQLGDLQSYIPSAVRQIHSRLQSETWGRWLLAQIEDSEQLARGASFIFSGIRGAMYLTGAAIAAMFLITVSSLYFGAEPDLYLRGVRRIVPETYRSIFEDCLISVTKTVRAWLLARLLSMTAIGALISCGLFVMGVPLAGTLGVIAALLTFVPNIGPILSVVPAALLAFAISPAKGIFTILLFCLAHFLEGNLVSPLVDRGIVKLPPSLTLTVQLLLGSIAGAFGVALAAPLTAVALSVLNVVLPPEKSRPAPSGSVRKLPQRVQAL